MIKIIKQQNEGGGNTIALMHALLHVNSPLGYVPDPVLPLKSIKGVLKRNHRFLLLLLLLYLSSIMFCYFLDEKNLVKTYSNASVVWLGKVCAAV